MSKQYTINDVAKLLGISADAIRLYEKEGLVEPIRDSKNGYRYYGFEQIHRIMGISLYRQLDVGIHEIREILSQQTFDGIIERFDDFIKNGEQEISCLQQRIGKLGFMKHHLSSLAQGVDTFSLRQLPDCYVLFHQDSAELKYDEMQKLLTSPNFSFGNLCYILKFDSEMSYSCDELEFLVRKPMLELTSLKDKEDTLPVRKSCDCVYTVKSASDSERRRWDLSKLYEYAAQQGAHCCDFAYAFYVFSMLNDDKIDDYYEIYLPVEKMC